MAGIYIHIPFCKQACNYCNFHFSTSLKQSKTMIDAMLLEIKEKHQYLNSPIETIYFGGGTPSILPIEDIHTLFDGMQQYFDLNHLKEVSLEANPDDMSEEYLHQLGQTPINRLSIGIQSFKASDLIFMNRAHNATEANTAIATAQKAGFDNITIDLIYGTPGLSNADWKENLQKAIDLGVQHISSYALTVEEKTVLAHQIKQGKTIAPKSDQAAEQFEILVETLKDAGFEHYEISNFAKNKHYALHNTNYWKGIHYIGLGPSAHSFNGNSRQWNVANNAQYINGLQRNEPFFEMEILSLSDQMNESLLTSLRTMWGLDLEAFGLQFGKENLDALLINLKEENAAHYRLSNNNLVLTEAGKLFADGIAANLFFD